jgi:hypothetical protein
MILCPSHTSSRPHINPINSRAARNVASLIVSKLLMGVGEEMSGEFDDELTDLRELDDINCKRQGTRKVVTTAESHK